MKSLLNLSILLAIVLLVSACGGSSSSSDLPPLKIEIPAELEDNDEMVDFIEKSEKTINEYSETIEEAAKDLKKYNIKDTEDLSVMDKVKLTALASKFTINFSEFMTEYSELMDQAQTFENNLGEEQIKALETVITAFQKRMELLENTYNNISEE